MVRTTHETVLREALEEYLKDINDENTVVLHFPQKEAASVINPPVIYVSLVSDEEYGSRGAERIGNGIVRFFQSSVCQIDVYAEDPATVMRGFRAWLGSRRYRVWSRNKNATIRIGGTDTSPDNKGRTIDKRSVTDATVTMQMRYDFSIPDIAKVNIETEVR